MNRKYFNYYLIVLCFWSVGINTRAGNLVNVFTNETLEFSSHSDDIVSRQDFIKGKFSFDYFKIKTEKGYYIQSINEQIVSLCKEYINQEEKLVGIYKTVVGRVTNYHKVQKSRNKDEDDDDYDYEDDNYDDKISLELDDMEANPVSYVSNFIFFTIQFSFKLKNDYYDEGIFEYYVYFKADLSNGVITEIKNTITDENKKKLATILAPKINENFTLITSKLSKEDYEYLYYEKELKSKFVKDVSKLVKMEDAVFYWVGWGLVISFQNYTESSLLYSGYSFSIFLPLEEAKQVLALLPEFQFANYLQMPGTSLKDISVPDLPKNKINYSFYRNIEDLVPMIESKELPKFLTKKMYQILRDTVKTYRGKEIFEFNKKGELLQKTFYDANENESHKVSWEWDKSGKKIARFEELNRGKEKEAEYFRYDTQGNLLEVDEISSSDFMFTYYFYNGNYIYSIDQEWFVEENFEEVKQMSYNESELRNGNIIYLLDKEGAVKGITSDKYVGYQQQIGYDEKGRVVELHRDRDRYHTYFYYDKNDRLEKIQTAENQRIDSEGKFFFEGTFPYPQSYSFFRTSGGNKTLLEEEYKWDFFEK